jgi:hypothetical protein
MQIHGSGFLAEIAAFPQVDRDITGVSCGFHMQPYSVSDPFRKRLPGSERRLLTWGASRFKIRDQSEKFCANHEFKHEGESSPGIVA